MQNDRLNACGEAGIEVGACGWLRPGWQGAFYPDDLPDDWRLDYYANQFNAVLAGAEHWRPGRGYPVAQWRESIEAPFRLYLAAPDEDVFGQDAQWRRFCDQLDALRGVLAGVVAGSPRSSRKLVDRLVSDMGGAAAPVSGASAMCWWPHEGGKRPQDAPLWLLHDDLQDLRVLRPKIESFAARHPGGGILVEHPSLSAEALLRLRQVVEIMGL